MSNSSLRDQLAALSGKSESDSSKKIKNFSIKAKVGKKVRSIEKNAAIPAWLEQARYGVALLKVYFSKAFDENRMIRPLKTGIREDLVKALGSHQDIALGDKACMVSSLSYYVNSVGYHKAVVEGADRIDLFGESVGKVTPEEAVYSRKRLEAKLEKRKKKTHKEHSNTKNTHQKNTVQS